MFSLIAIFDNEVRGEQEEERSKDTVKCFIESLVLLPASDLGVNQTNCNDLLAAVIEMTDKVLVGYITLLTSTSPGSYATRAVYIVSFVLDQFSSLTPVAPS